MSIPILHPEIFRYCWTSENFSNIPTMCCWPVDNSGLLIRAFHLHPFIVDFSRVAAVEVLENDTIDGDFVGQSIGTWTDVHIEQDSDNIGLYSLTPDDAIYFPPTHATGSIEVLRSEAFAPNVSAFHRYLFSHGIKMHTDDVSERWIELEEQTGLLLHLALQPLPQPHPKRRDLFYKAQELYWTISRMQRWVREYWKRRILRRP